MNYISKIRRAAATIALSVCGMTAHADGLTSIGFSVFPELYSTNDYTGDNSLLGVFPASLEVESQQALDLLTQQLTAAHPTRIDQFEDMFFGAASALNHTHSAFSAGASVIQLATLETESSRAIEDMKRLLQQGQSPSNTQTLELDRPVQSFGLGL